MEERETNVRLDFSKIVSTVCLLEKRIADRFPGSGLLVACQDFIRITEKCESNIAWINKPHRGLRAFIYVVILIGLMAVLYSFTLFHFDLRTISFTDFIQLAEATFNDLVLLGAAIFFLVTLENRLKRSRALKSLNELRVMIHVIDMHQLTKDPHHSLRYSKPTTHSPKRVLTKFELQRYLDYCGEILSLVSKVAALYSQSLPDEGVVSSVNDIESLSTGMSRKIWQKLIILNEIELLSFPGEKKPPPSRL